MRLLVSAVAARLPPSLRVAPQRSVCRVRAAVGAARPSSAAGAVPVPPARCWRSFSSAPAASAQSPSQSQSRVSSDGSHADFSARPKASAGGSAGAGGVGSDASGLISADVSGHAVFLYMKGSPAAPKCGFSANVVRILQHLGAAFSSRDVLEEPAVREAVKQFSDWPTLPQLYVRGEFVGGSDIITQLFKSGELEKMLTQAGVIQPAAPSSAHTAAAGAADSKLAQ